MTKKPPYHFSGIELLHCFHHRSTCLLCVQSFIMQHTRDSRHGNARSTCNIGIVGRRPVESSLRCAAELLIKSIVALNSAHTSSS